MISKILGKFVFKNYYRQIVFTTEDSHYLLKNVKKKKDLVLLATNLTKKTLTIPELKNAMNYF